MNFSPPSTPPSLFSVWWRDKILPTVLTAAMVGTFVAGIAGWRELSIINVKLDQRSEQIDDLESRVRYLEREISTQP